MVSPAAPLLAHGAGSLPPLRESYQASGLAAFEEMQPEYNLLAGGPAGRRPVICPMLSLVRWSVRRRVACSVCLSAIERCQRYRGPQPPAAAWAVYAASGPLSQPPPPATSAPAACLRGCYGLPAHPAPARRAAQATRRPAALPRGLPRAPAAQGAARFEQPPSFPLQGCSSHTSTCCCARRLPL